MTSFPFMVNKLKLDKFHLPSSHEVRTARGVEMENPFSFVSSPLSTKTKRRQLGDLLIRLAPDLMGWMTIAFIHRFLTDFILLRLDFPLSLSTQSISELLFFAF